MSSKGGWDGYKAALFCRALRPLLHLGCDRAHPAWSGGTGRAMKISGDWISHPGTQALCAALAKAGHQALFVGGCVRNALLNGGG